MARRPPVELKKCEECGKIIPYLPREGRINYGNRHTCRGKKGEMNPCTLAYVTRMNQKLRNGPHPHHKVGTVKDANRKDIPADSWYAGREMLSEAETERLDREQWELNKAIEKAAAQRMGHVVDPGRSLSRAEIDALVAQGAITPVSQIRAGLLAEPTIPGLTGGTGWINSDNGERGRVGHGGKEWTPWARPQF